MGAGGKRAVAGAGTFGSSPFREGCYVAKQGEAHMLTAGQPEDKGTRASCGQAALLTQLGGHPPFQIIHRLRILSIRPATAIAALVCTWPLGRCACAL